MNNHIRRGSRFGGGSAFAAIFVTPDLPDGTPRCDGYGPTLVPRQKGGRGTILAGIIVFQALQRAPFPFFTTDEHPACV